MDGDMESFEAAQDTFCTADMDESEGDGAAGVLDVYNSFSDGVWPWHGSYSAEITLDADAPNEMVGTQTDDLFGAGTNTKWITFCFYLDDDLPDGMSADDIFLVENDVGNDIVALKFVAKASDATTQYLYFRGAAQDADPWAIEIDNTYCVAVYINDNGNDSLCYVYDCNSGTCSIHQTAGAQNFLTEASANYDFRNVNFVSNYDDSTGIQLYIDRVKAEDSNPGPNF